MMSCALYCYAVLTRMLFTLFQSMVAKDYQFLLIKIEVVIMKMHRNLRQSKVYDGDIKGDDALPAENLHDIKAFHEAQMQVRLN